VGTIIDGINWRQLGKLFAVVTLVQAIYWLAIDQPMFRADPGEAPPLAPISAVEVARLIEPSFAEAANARYEPVELPWTYCCDTAVFAVRMTFMVDQVPTNGLGIISYLETDNYLLAVNGTPIVARGRMQPGDGSFHGQIRTLTRMPSGLLKPGANTLTYITMRDGFPYTDVLEPKIADFAALEAYSARSLFLASGYNLLTGGLLGLLGLIATVMVFRSDDWRFAAWLSLLCAAFVANAGYFLWLDPPIDGWGRMVAFFAISQLIPAAMLCFIDSWTGRPIPWLQALTMVVYAAAIGVIVWYIYRVPMPEGFDVPTAIWIWHLGASAVAVALRLVWHFATCAEDRLLESALLTVMAVALAMDAASAWFPEQHVQAGNVRYSAVFLLLAMTAAFLARNFRLFQSQGALNAMLQAKVTQREAELAEAALREQALVRAQAHDEERRRIMRDLHDGLGSQLMTMMLTARMGEADPPKVAEGLQGVIDEMRLMVDSMDSVGESLEAALATFRARIQPRVEAAGFAFRWQQDETLPAPDLGPRDVLQVFRIMQEAVTNALRHSGGSAITARVAAVGADSVAITIADDGKGGATSGEAGRGLANMKNRARAVGADYALASASGEGTRVTLTLRQPALAAHPM
jgi:two-component system, NarL family, sensor histidine kinase UhpB